jgi:phage terminase large subunit GpA-like protein
MRAQEIAIRAFCQGLRPDPLLKVSEWADRHRILSREASNEAGPWRTDRTPYLREIMDTLSPHHPAVKVVFMKCSQVGGSEGGNNWVGYVIDLGRGSMLVLQPNEGVATEYATLRIEPMINASPRLKKKVAKGKGKSVEKTCEKRFDGGVLYVIGASSSAGLASKPIPFIMADECDRYPLDVDGEGDPLTLAERRTSTFPGAKIFIPSTPTIDGRSRIQKEFEVSDQRHYHVPCPHCEHYQKLRLVQLQFGNDPNTAEYVCEKCEKRIPEHHKTKMLAAGRWIAENPGAEVVGFHINALYSPLGWLSWKKIARMWIDAQKDPEKLKAFVNTILGEVWKEPGEAPEWERLYERREKYPPRELPWPAIFVTGGADVQKNRIELQLVAWGPGKESWSLDYRILEGDTSTEDGEAFKKLDQVLAEEFRHASGMMVPIRLLAIDSGYNTQAVYDWARSYPVTRVIAIKGSDTLAVAVGMPKAVDTKSNGKRVRRGLRVWMVGSSVLKSMLYSLLRLKKPVDGEPFPPGYPHFPEEYDETFFKGLTAEQVVMRTVRGYKRPTWEKKFERNEPLDTWVYARAAATAVGMDRWNDEKWKDLALDVGARPAAASDPVVTNHQVPQQSSPAPSSPIVSKNTTPQKAQISTTKPRKKVSFL